MKTIFRRIGGRIVPIARKLSHEVQSIPTIFKKAPKALNQKKGKALLTKIDGKIAGAKSFLEDGGFSTNASYDSAGKLCHQISRDRTRYLNLKNNLEDNAQAVSGYRQKRNAGIRGIVKGSALGVGAGALAVNRRSKK